MDEESQSAFMRGFIDDEFQVEVTRAIRRMSQSAFMRGFIDDGGSRDRTRDRR